MFGPQTIQWNRYHRDLSFQHVLFPIEIGINYKKPPPPAVSSEELPVLF